MRSDVIDIDVLWMHETEKAVLVAETEETEPVWLPKSLVEIDAPSKVRARIAR